MARAESTVLHDACRTYVGSPTGEPSTMNPPFFAQMLSTGMPRASRDCCWWSLRPAGDQAWNPAGFSTRQTPVSRSRSHVVAAATSCTGPTRYMLSWKATLTSSGNSATRSSRIGRSTRSNSTPPNGSPCCEPHAERSVTSELSEQRNKRSLGCR